MWHLTHDRWGEVYLLSIFQLASSYGLGMKVFWRYFNLSWPTQWMNHVAVYGTALATPGLLRGTLEMLFILHRAKLFQLFSLHPSHQQVYSCCYSFLIITQSYNSKNTPIGKLHAEKITKAVLLYVLWIAFPTSPLMVPTPMYSKNGWTWELWSMTNLLSWQN